MSKLFGIVLTTITAVGHTMADDVDDLIRELNATSAAQGTDDIKSWREVFGTILDAPEAPMDTSVPSQPTRLTYRHIG